MLFSVLSGYFSRMEAISKRLELIEIVKEVIRESGEDIGITLYLCEGKIAPDFMSKETGIAESTIMKVIGQITGASEKEIMKEYSRTGDLGTVAQQFSGRKKQKSFFNMPLEAREVHESLLKISRIKGSGTASEREKILTSLLLRANELESKYIVRIMNGKMRLGVSDSTIISAMRILIRPDLEQSQVEEIYNFHPDMNYLYEVLSGKGGEIISGPSRRIAFRL